MEKYWKSDATEKRNNFGIKGKMEEFFFTENRFPNYAANNMSRLVSFPAEIHYFGNIYYFAFETPDITNDR